MERQHIRVDLVQQDSKVIKIGFSRIFPNMDMLNLSSIFFCLISCGINEVARVNLASTASCYLNIVEMFLVHDGTHKHTYIFKD